MTSQADVTVNTYDSYHCPNM